MANARLHIICGNCGNLASTYMDNKNMFEYEIAKNAMDFGGHQMDAIFIWCKNCSTLHNLEDTIKLKKKLLKGETND